MSSITVYLVLKYLVQICHLTPLILSKTTKKRRFLGSGMVKKRVSGQFRPAGRSVGHQTKFKTFPDKFRFDPCIICLYLSIFPGGVRQQTDRQTHRHTDTHLIPLISIELGSETRRSNPCGVHPPGVPRQDTKEQFPFRRR